MYDINIEKLLTLLTKGLQTAKDTTPLKLCLEVFVLTGFFYFLTNQQDFEEKIAAFRVPKLFI